MSQKRDWCIRLSSPQEHINFDEGIVSVICLQKTWLSSSNMYKLHNFSKSHSSYGVSAMGSLLPSSVLRGRPFGGCATLIKNSLLPVTKCLKCDDRFVILMIGDIIFRNVYFPCKGSDSLAVLQDMICEIDSALRLFCITNLYFRGTYTITCTRVINILS